MTKRKVTATAGTFVRLEIKGEGKFPTVPLDNGECGRLYDWLIAKGLYFHAPIAARQGHMILLIDAERWDEVAAWLKDNGIKLGS